MCGNTIKNSITVFVTFHDVHKPYTCLNHKLLPLNKICRLFVFISHERVGLKSCITVTPGGHTSHCKNCSLSDQGRML